MKIKKLKRSKLRVALPLNVVSLLSTKCVHAHTFKRTKKLKKKTTKKETKI